MKDGHRLYIIAALDQQGGIGTSGKIPWRLKKDLVHFRAITSQPPNSEQENIVIMGRKTWESLPKKYRPLPQRQNIVITHQPQYIARGALIAQDITSAITQAVQCANGGDIFFIGGATIYKQVIQRSDIDGLFLTLISHNFHCDIFFPPLPARFNVRKKIGSLEEDGITLDFVFLTVQDSGLTPHLFEEDEGEGRRKTPRTPLFEGGLLHKNPPSLRGDFSTKNPLL